MVSTLAVSFALALLSQGATPAARPAPPQGAATAAAPSPLTALFPEERAPSESVLGVTVYPTAQFLGSYDAGRGQRYYLYGTTAGFNEMVAYYRTLLKQKGSTIFDTPPVYIFEIGKYDDNSMAFPPSVTVKDYTADGNGGYLNPRPGATPERFPTILQIVPAYPAR
jgi:hypothetical protein